MTILDSVSPIEAETASPLPIQCRCKHWGCGECGERRRKRYFMHFDEVWKPEGNLYFVTMTLPGVFTGKTLLSQEKIGKLRSAWFEGLRKRAGRKGIAFRHLESLGYMKTMTCHLHAIVEWHGSISDLRACWKKHGLKQQLQIQTIDEVGGFRKTLNYVLRNAREAGEVHKRESIRKSRILTSSRNIAYGGKKAKARRKKYAIQNGLMSDGPTHAEYFSALMYRDVYGRKETRPRARGPLVRRGLTVWRGDERRIF